MRGLLIIALLALPVAVPAASAHPGGLAADGCHNDRKNGGRHCHGGAAAAMPQPRQSFGSFVAGAFRNCAEARAAGAAPVRRGDAG